MLSASKAALLVTTVGFLGTDTVGMLAPTPTAASRTCAGSCSSTARPSAETALRRASTWSAGTTFAARAERSPPPRRRSAGRACEPTDTSDILFTSGTTGRPKGVIMTHGQTVRQFREWCEFAGLRARRPLSDRQPVLPHVRVQGRVAGEPAPGRHHRSGSGVRRADACCRWWRRERITVLPGAPTDLPLDPRPSRSRPIRSAARLRVAVTGAADIPVALIERDARRAAVPLDPHRLRAHRGRHVHGIAARRRRGDDRHDGRARDARSRDHHRRPRRGRRSSGARRASCSSAATA